MFGSSKLGRMTESDRLNVAARPMVQVFPAARSRCTTAAMPFSRPIAVAGNLGSVIRDASVGIVLIDYRRAFTTHYMEYLRMRHLQRRCVYQSYRFGLRSN